MIIRLRSRDGLERIEVEDSGTIAVSKAPFCMWVFLTR